MYDMTGFDYDISDVVNLLKLQVRHKNSVSLDVNCPFCGEIKRKDECQPAKKCIPV